MFRGGDFGDIKVAADRTMRLAHKDVADQLTAQFQEHLIKNGVPKKAAGKSKMKYDKSSRKYRPDVPPSVKKHSEGTGGKSPSGAVTKFTNRLKESDITAMHDAALFVRSRENHLI